MTFVERVKIGIQARRDAAVGRQQTEERVVALTGPRPEWDVEKYPGHGFLADDLQLDRGLRELEDPNLTPSSEDQPPPAPVLLGGIVLFVMVGDLASIQVLALLGMSPAHRLLLGVGLECLLVVLTSGVRAAFEAPSWRGASVVLVYILLLASTAALRVSDLAVPDQGPTAMDWAAAILLVLATAGPAWLTESCLRSLRESAPNRHRGHLTSRRISSDRQRVMAARGYLEGLSQQQWEWDRTYGQLKAIYDTTFHQKAATKQLDNDADQPVRRRLSTY